MTSQHANRLFAYTRWANARMLDAAAGLTDEQLHRDLKSSFPSVRDTLVHMLSADWVWLERWRGNSPTAFPESADLRTVADIRARWALVDEARTTFLAGLTDETLTQPISYRNLKGDPFTDPLAPLITHVVNHGTYHRGQVTTMLRQLGVTSVAATDYVAWRRENPS